MPSVMEISNWERLDGAPEKQTADQYRRQQAEASNLSLEEFDRYLMVVACDCGEDYCRGWAAMPRYKHGEGWRKS